MTDPGSLCIYKGEDVDDYTLTREDYDLLLLALDYMRSAFTAYEHYPSPEFRRARIAAVDDLRLKLLEAKRAS